MKKSNSHEPVKIKDTNPIKMKHVGEGGEVNNFPVGTKQPQSKVDAGKKSVKLGSHRR